MNIAMMKTTLQSVTLMEVLAVAQMLKLTSALIVNAKKVVIHFILQRVYVT